MSRRLRPLRRRTYVEAAAALAAATRAGRLTNGQRGGALELLERLRAELDAVEVDESLVRHAARLADRLALRGYDAVHCASAAQLDDDDLVAATGDARLLRAWAELGISTFDPHLPV